MSSDAGDDVEKRVEDRVEEGAPEAVFEVPERVDFALVLQRLRPGSAWSLLGDSYDGLLWHDTATAPPTLAECVAAWPQVALDEANAHVSWQRQQMFSAEADPLFFKVAAGEIPASVWHARRRKVRHDLPYYALPSQDAPPPGPRAPEASGPAAPSPEASAPEAPTFPDVPDRRRSV